MRRKRNKIFCSSLVFLSIVTYLFSDSFQSGVSYAQKTRKKSRQNIPQRKPLRIQIFPPGYIVTTEDAQRIRAALLTGTGNDHDDPGHLADYGDIDSVPAMLAVLRRNPANPNGSMMCTRWHCLMALRKLTKADVGNETEDWEKWWEEHQKEREAK